MSKSFLTILTESYLEHRLAGKSNRQQLPGRSAHYQHVQYAKTTRTLGNRMLMENRGIPKNLSGEMVIGGLHIDRPKLSYEDFCKADFKSQHVEVSTLKTTACERLAWRLRVRRVSLSLKRHLSNSPR